MAAHDVTAMKRRRTIEGTIATRLAAHARRVAALRLITP